MCLPPLPKTAGDDEGKPTRPLPPTLNAADDYEKPICLLPLPKIADEEGKPTGPLPPTLNTPAASAQDCCKADDERSARPLPRDH